MIASLLNQASALRRTQEKITLLSGENFNVFRILGLESKEVRMHSAFLGELLNPAGSHGLKDAFLRLFTDIIDLEGFETSSARLVVEYDIGRIIGDYMQGGRIDIYIESRGKYIFIENKIYAGEQQNQLKRYHNHRTDAKLLYLTLNGDPATELGAGALTDEQYVRMSYHTDIMNWLEKCRQAATAFPLIRETIVQYQHLINHLTGRTPTEHIKMELQNIVSQTEDSFLSAHALGDAANQTRDMYIDYLIEEFKKEWSSRFSENLSPISEYEIYFQLLNNSYGFRGVKNGEEVPSGDEEGLRPLTTLALSIQKLRRDYYWMAWRWMENRYFNNLPLIELYQAATNTSARKHLFEVRLQEGAFYFNRFKELISNFK